MSFRISIAAIYLFWLIPLWQINNFPILLIYVIFGLFRNCPISLFAVATLMWQGASWHVSSVFPWSVLFAVTSINWRNPSDNCRSHFPRICRAWVNFSEWWIWEIWCETTGIIRYLALCNFWGTGGWRNVVPIFIPSKQSHGHVDSPLHFPFLRESRLLGNVNISDERISEHPEKDLRLPDRKSKMRCFSWPLLHGQRKLKLRERSEAFSHWIVYLINMALVSFFSRSGQENLEIHVKLVCVELLISFTRFSPVESIGVISIIEVEILVFRTFSLICMILISSRTSIIDKISRNMVRRCPSNPEIIDLVLIGQSGLCHQQNLDRLIELLFLELSLIIVGLWCVNPTIFVEWI
jgi:hypothetical protein